MFQSTYNYLTLQKLYTNVTALIVRYNVICISKTGIIVVRNSDLLMGLLYHRCLVYGSQSEE